MLQQHGPAEDFYAIVRVGKYLHVIDVGSTADPPQGQAVDLVVRTQFGATVADRYIMQDPGIIGIVVTTVFGAAFRRRNPSMFSIPPSSPMMAFPNRSNHPTALSAAVRSRINQVVQFTVKMIGASAVPLANLSATGDDQCRAMSSEGWLIAITPASMFSTYRTQEYIASR
ncbi:MAG: hypothetical protein R2806_08190 [Saprospiraceae bacterium]